MQSEVRRARTSAERGVVSLVDALANALEAVPTPAPPLPFYGQDASGDVDGYDRWLANHAPDLASLQHRLDAIADPPRFSVVIPVYKPDLAFFRRCVDSVRRQLYPHWELCLCDDGSGDPALTALLQQLPQVDGRIRTTALARNGGISAATNGALGLATAPFVAFMDHDDELTVDALAEVALALDADPGIDVLYTDEDKIDERNRRYAPFFKPGWSPDYLLTCAYTGHLSVVRRTLVDEVGGLRTEYDGSQDHDLMMRVTEAAREVRHLPKILYHWRAIEGSAASSSDAKPWAHAAGYAAVADTLRRRGESGEVLPGAFAGARRVKRSTDGAGHVSIVIPFRDGAPLLHRCLQSIRELAGYDRWDAVLLDNGSWEPETRALLRQLEDDDRITIIPDPSPFNWSALNNRGAAAARGDLLLFMNNDVEGTSEGWLEALVEHARRPEVGAVGGRLLYPDGTVQHAGLVIGMGGIAGHAFRYCPSWYPAYFGMGKVIRNYSAVTGACMMVRRDVFSRVGGFDDTLPVAYNDVDFCLRLRERDLLVVYTPYAELVHYESLTRGQGSDSDEGAAMLARWKDVFVAGDPYFNENLSLSFSEFRIKEADERPPWRSLLESVE